MLNWDSTLASILREIRDLKASLEGDNKKAEQSALDALQSKFTLFKNETNTALRKLQLNNKQQAKWMSETSASLAELWMQSHAAMGHDDGMGDLIGQEDGIGHLGLEEQLVQM